MNKSANSAYTVYSTLTRPTFNTSETRFSLCLKQLPASLSTEKAMRLKRAERNGKDCRNHTKFRPIRKEFAKTR